MRETHNSAVTDQPDGIDPESRDLPDPARAAERVREFLSWWGDGLIDEVTYHDGAWQTAPLYARDLQALANHVTHTGDHP